MEVRVEIKNQLIKYNISNGFSREENSFLANTIKQAYIILYNTRIDLKDEKNEKIESFAEAIFKNSDFSILRRDIEEIILKIREGKLKFLKQKNFEEKGSQNEFVLASVEKDEDSLIKIYTPFFDIKNIKDDRVGVIIHEIAHLCGLEREDEKFSLESAEALKNFCLLCADKISLEEINSENDTEENISDENEDELTYQSEKKKESVENQPRVQAGDPDGGQWVATSGGNSGTQKTENKTANKTPNKTANKSNLEEYKCRGKVHEEINESIKPNGEVANQKGKEIMDEWKKTGKGGTRMSKEEDQYIKDIKEKYKKYDRKITPKEVESLVSEVCDALAKETGLPVNKEAAKNLLFGTAAVESDMRARLQENGGQALGLFQMEYITFRNLVNNDTGSKNALKIIAAAEKLFNNGKKIEFEDLIKDDRLATAMARVRYWVCNGDIKNDIKEIAEYWKQHYNTKKGKGNVKNFIDKFNEYKNIINNNEKD